ncbi:hypothetical protein J5N97_021979 [Dioscorea zingiberensis]|uniref:SKP1-like protein n=1 Tax=Dioscorea zingiberensis TaxID=325984 RepID=A0A9D5CAL5_9LILI|nr:hypothetical protein J5N97_021979 [Dioscorea zingiberensis]
MEVAAKMVILRCKDGEEFTVEEKVAAQLNTIKIFKENKGQHHNNNVFTLDDISGKLLSNVLKYCEKHVGEMPEKELRMWDKEYMKTNEDLESVFRAARFLEIVGLVKLVRMTMEERRVRKKIEKMVGVIFCGKHFTVEEKEKLISDFKSAFERNIKVALPL